MIQNIPTNNLAAAVNWQQKRDGQKQQVQEAGQSTATAQNEKDTQMESAKALKPPVPRTPPNK